ncbi:MAG: hypothetical protein OEZ01_07105, partial [Candidatus Heimdallarchaeota archaeon]|nr:hypothetical protein [Candidatus Heimdallarchaeota archaeon]
MSNLDKITEIWENEEVREIKDVLVISLDLLKQAKREGEDIPFEIEADIIISANYALEYGSKFEDALDICAFIQSIKTKKIKIDEHKVLRLNSLASGILISTMIGDAHNNTHNAAIIMEYLGHASSMDTSSIIKTMAGYLNSSISNSRPSKWSLEVVSFVITLKSLGEELGSWNTEDDNIIQLDKMFTKPFDETEQRYLDIW